MKRYTITIKLCEEQIQLFNSTKSLQSFHTIATKIL